MSKLLVRLSKGNKLHVYHTEKVHEPKNDMHVHVV